MMQILTRLLFETSFIVLAEYLVFAQCINLVACKLTAFNIPCQPFPQVATVTDLPHLTHKMHTLTTETAIEQHTK